MTSFYLDPARVRDELDARRARYCPPLELIDIVGLTALGVSHYLYYRSPGRDAKAVDLERLMAIDLSVFAFLVDAAPRFAHKAGVLPSADLQYSVRIRNDQIQTAFGSWYVEALTPAYSVPNDPVNSLDLGTRAGQLKHQYAQIVAGCGAFDGESSFRALHDALARSAGERPPPIVDRTQINKAERQAMPATMRFLASQEGVMELLEITPEGQIAVGKKRALKSAVRVFGSGRSGEGMLSLDVEIGEDGAGGSLGANEADRKALTPEQLTAVEELRELRDRFDDHPSVTATIDAFLADGRSEAIHWAVERVGRLRDILDETRDPASQGEFLYHLSRKAGGSHGSRPRKEYADDYGVAVGEMRGKKEIAEALVRRLMA